MSTSLQNNGNETPPPKVSIGLPVRNGGKFLEETLSSLVSQDYPDLEIIVSDNNSDDETAGILARFQSKDPRIRVFTQTEILNVADNFIFVLKEAKGEYFCWSAHDDLREKVNIRRLVELLDEHREVICAMTDVVNFGGEGEPERIDRLEGIRVRKVLASWDEVRRLFFAVPTTNIFFCIYGLYRTDVLRQINLKINLGFYANAEIPFLAQVALKGRIVSLEYEGFRYRRHPQSIYHLEVAKDDPGAPARRHNVVRRAVCGILLRSSLPLSEKAAIFREIWRGWRAEMRSERLRVAKAERQVRKKVMRKQKQKPSWLRRVKNGLRRRLFGAPNPPAPEKKEPVDRIPAAELPPDHVMVRRRINLERPNLNALVAREEARRRLESQGWKFEQTKRYRLLVDHRIESLIDCGANCGQFVEHLRGSGWSGQVFSFEPLAKEFLILKNKAEAVEGWTAFPYALGEERGEAEIQIAGNSYSSSLLQFSDGFKKLRPDASPVGTEIIQVRRLDDFIDEEGLTFAGPILLKLDVQGFELNVLRGADEFLNRVSLVQTEMALIPSYENAPNFAEVKAFLNDRGFVLVHLIDGHANHLTGELREVDGIFVNTALLDKPSEPDAG